jgi:hypothetical protein
MKKTLFCVFLFSSFALIPGVSAETALSERLSPLGFLPGEWQVRWTEADGNKMTGRATVKPEANGKALALAFRTDATQPGGSPAFSQFSIFFWNYESKSLAEQSFEANGMHGSSTLKEITGNKLLWKGRGISPEGKEGRRNTEMVKVDGNTWTVQFIAREYDGQSRPDGPVFTFARVK